MLMSKVYVYVVDRDFGFAPNPFGGALTLATCKPRIRAVASVDDWIIGVGGSRLKRRGHCIFGMRVTDSLTLTEYWTHPGFQGKKPVRNGSFVSLVGDNIYQKVDDIWMQADSHHSLADGSPNRVNIQNDTGTDRMLISEEFYYFGSDSPEIPREIVAALDYKNGRNHRTFDIESAAPLINWVQKFPVNRVLSDPCDFVKASSRYEAQRNRVI